MRTKSFTIKIVVKAIIFAIASIIMFIIFNNPVITNEIALGQMDNSDELYLLMETYNKVKQYALIAYGCISALVVGTAIYDIDNFKNNKGENEE